MGNGGRAFKTVRFPSPNGRTPSKEKRNEVNEVKTQKCISVRVGEAPLPDIDTYAFFGFLPGGRTPNPPKSIFGSISFWPILFQNLL